MGYVGWQNNVATQESVVVKLLREAGAVFYVKTNVPTSLMCPETINNVIGRTLNAYDSDHTSGGSSGGGRCCVF